MATMQLSLKSKEELEQEEAAAKIQAIKRGNEARAEVELKKAIAASPVWAAAKAGDAAALEALLPSPDVALVGPGGSTALTAAIEKGTSAIECAKLLIAYNEGLGVGAAELAVWEAIQKDMLPGVDEEGGETEPKDVAGEEYQAELAASMSCDPALIKQLVKIGLYVGARAEIAEYDKAFDTQVGDRSGYGVDLSPAGDIYAGMYAGGVRAGVGALKTKEGTVYAGEWLGGKRHGKGSMTYKDGGKYVGKWSYGKRHGAGTFTYSNGDSYTGQWHAGNKHGEGKYSAVEAKVVYEGTWKHGALVASKVVMLSAENAAYYGGFDKAGRPTGAGAFAYGNGVTLSGDYDAPPIEEAEGDEPPPVLPAVWKGGACGKVEATTDADLKTTYCTVKPTLNVVIAGAPASGKGTQCEKIIEKYGLVHISTGDLLRAAAADPDNEAGQIAKEKMEAGELVPDELVTRILREKLETAEVLEKGFLLDGYPRTAVQAAGMESYFAIPNKCILLDVPDEVLIARVTGRRQDPETGIIYPLETKKPYKLDEEGNPVDAVDEEGNPTGEKAIDEEIMARLTQRGDDTAEALEKRLIAFAANRDSVAAQFASIALTINGNRPPAEVWADLDAFLSK